MNLISLLGWKDAVQLHGLKLEADHIQLHLATNDSIVLCPFCGYSSSRIHSRYSRKLTDLPWAGKSVLVILQLRRFFCDNKACSHKTFAERLVMAPAYARKAARLQDQLLQLAAQLGGRAGAKLARLLGMEVSHYSLLRSLMKLPDLPVTTPKVLGVDDWSMKKGLVYATILVDIEKQRPVDLLADRESKTLSQWLQAHPGIEIITRDRANCYAEGAKLGAPDAIQVVDRWHLDNQADSG
jgi:transposase